jgi:OOP family OmpA-OmpF porin
MFAMKKSLLSLSFALALAVGTSAVSAQDVNSNGAGGFMGATVGTANWHGDGASINRLSYGVSGGYRWALDQNQSLGAELGYVNFGTLRADTDFGRAKLDAQAYTLGGNYRYSFGDGSMLNNYFFSARAGYLRLHASERDSVTGVGSVSGSNDSNGYYAGVGIGRDFGQNVAVSLNYDFHRANTDPDHINFGVTSVGLQYRF